MIALFDDAGFVIGGYLLTFATVGVLGWRYVSAGRRLGRRVPDDEKYWT